MTYLAPRLRSLQSRSVCDVVDLKSPYSLGHAHAVAGLVADAGARLGLPDVEVRTPAAGVLDRGGFRCPHA